MLVEVVEVVLQEVLIQLVVLGGGGAGKAGVPSTQVAGDNGTANTGGGGGGGSDYLSSGVTQSSGGKGVVILSMPDWKLFRNNNWFSNSSTSGNKKVLNLMVQGVTQHNGIIR
jgi:hypothetical protein